MGRRVRIEPDAHEAEQLTGWCDPLLLRDRDGEPFELDRRLLSPAVSEHTEEPTRPPSLRTIRSIPFSAVDGSIPEESDDPDEALPDSELVAWSKRRRSPPDRGRQLRRSTPDQTLHQLMQAERTLRRRIENEQAAAARRQFLAVKNHLVGLIEEDPAGATLRLGELYLVAAKAAGNGEDSDRTPVSLRIAVEWLMRSLSHDDTRAEPFCTHGLQVCLDAHRPSRPRT